MHLLSEGEGRASYQGKRNCKMMARAGEKRKPPPPHGKRRYIPLSRKEKVASRDARGEVKGKRSKASRGTLSFFWQKGGSLFFSKKGKGKVLFRQAEKKDAERLREKKREHRREGEGIFSLTAKRGKKKPSCSESRKRKREPRCAGLTEEKKKEVALVEKEELSVV